MKCTGKKKSLSGLWENIKQPNLHVTGIPEENGRKGQNDKNI